MRIYSYLLTINLTYEEKKILENAFSIFDFIVSTLNTEDKTIATKIFSKISESIKLKEDSI